MLMVSTMIHELANVKNRALKLRDFWWTCNVRLTVSILCFSFLSGWFILLLTLFSYTLTHVHTNTEANGVSGIGLPVESVMVPSWQLLHGWRYQPFILFLCLFPLLSISFFTFMLEYSLENICNYYYLKSFDGSTLNLQQSSHAFDSSEGPL